MSGRSSTNKFIVIALLRKTAAEFTALNPVLIAGQEGYETDTRKRKVGDGVTAWNALLYDVSSAGSSSSTTNNRRNWFYSRR